MLDFVVTRAAYKVFDSFLLRGGGGGMSFVMLCTITLSPVDGYQRGSFRGITLSSFHPSCAQVKLISDGFHMLHCVTN